MATVILQRYYTTDNVIVKKNSIHAPLSGCVYWTKNQTRGREKCMHSVVSERVGGDLMFWCNIETGEQRRGSTTKTTSESANHIKTQAISHTHSQHTFTHRLISHFLVLGEWHKQIQIIHRILEREKTIDKLNRLKPSYLTANQAWCALTCSQAHHTLNSTDWPATALGQRTWSQQGLRWSLFIKDP